MRLVLVVVMAIAGCAPAPPPDAKLIADPCFDCGPSMSRENLTGQILATVPANMKMPVEIVEAMRWLEARDAIYQSGYEFSISLFPNDESTRNDDVMRSPAIFFPIARDGDTAPCHRAPGANRLLRFMYLDDGSIGIWVDDAGKQHFVQLDHWGEKAIGIITDNPVDLLRYLAIGYASPAKYRGQRMTPEQLQIADAGGPRAGADAADQPRLQRPSEFAAYVAQRYGTVIPRDGADLVALRPGQQDAFTRWCASVRGTK